MTQPVLDTDITRTLEDSLGDDGSSDTTDAATGDPSPWDSAPSGLDDLDDALPSSTEAPATDTETVPTDAAPAAPTTEHTLEMERLRQDNVRLAEEQRRGQEELARQQQERIVSEHTAKIDADIQVLANQAQSQGYSPEHYNGILGQVRQAKIEALQTARDAAQLQTSEKNRARSAAKVMQETGASIDDIWGYNSEDEMRRAAQDKGRIASLEKELSDVKKTQARAKVPAQAYDGGQGRGGAMSDRAFIQHMADRDDVASEADWERHNRIIGNLS